MEDETGNEVGHPRIDRDDIHLVALLGGVGVQIVDVSGHAVQAMEALEECEARRGH